MTGQLRRGWTWWIGQLSDALPTLSTARNRAAIVAEIRDNTLILYGREMPHADLGQLSFNAGAAERELARARLIAFAGRNRRVVLRLPQEAGIRRRMTLPAAAEMHLPAIVSNELDRLTPWRPDQAIFHATLISPSASSVSIEVEVTVVPNFSFAQPAQALSKVEFELIGVLLAHTDNPATFIAVEPAIQAASLARKRKRAAVAALTSVGILILLALFAHKFWVVFALRSHMVELQQEAEKTQKMQDELAMLTKRTYYAVEMKRTHPVAIVTLEALSRTLPDDCWLDSFSLSGDQLTVEGHASDALALLPLLTSSGFFRDVHFNSEVLRDLETDTEGFSLTATVIPHAAP